MTPWVYAPVGAGAATAPGFEWSDLNPLKLLANAAAVTITAGWQDFMTSLWSAGLWLTGFVFRLVDAFTSPDLSEGGVMSKIYPVTFGIGAAVALLLAFVQVGFAAFQRDGRGLGRLIVGLWQFMLAWGGMLGVGAALSAATKGLTEGLLQVALGAPSFAKANVLASWQPRQGVDAVAATVLGVCGLFLVLAAIGYLLVMLVRAAALMILMATSPVSAAGLVSDAARAWFWKSLRWFLAALMIAPLAALVLGIGKLLTDGVLSGAGESTEAAVGAAFLGTVLILVGAFCPLILFRLLAFVDPGTSSGAAFRGSLDAAGGVGGLLGGRGADDSGGSGAATNQAPDGSSQGEADAATATQNRWAAITGSVGAAGSRLSSAASRGAAFGADVLGAAGVGHPQPYFFDGSASRRPSTQQSGQDRSSSGAASPSGDDGPPPPADPTPAQPPLPPPPVPEQPPGHPPAGGPGKAGGAAGGAGAEAGGAETAAAAAL